MVESKDKLWKLKIRKMMKDDSRERRIADGARELANMPSRNMTTTGRRGTKKTTTFSVFSLDRKLTEADTALR
jgi:hypothetical protein